VGCWRPTSP